MTNGENCREGRPLVEVFSVTINNIKRDHIYGKIEFSDGLSISESIYNLRKNNSESISTGDTILLNGPARCITAEDDVIFKVDLKSKERFSDDDEIIKGEILWEVMNISANKYDKLLRHQVNGQYGASATVNYAVLRNAVQARIEVTLVTPYSREEGFYFGKFTAHINKIGEKIVLLKAYKNRNVKPGEMIPLSRSVVAVPLNSDLIVSIDLKDGIAISGQATFSARLSGTNEQYISFDSLSNVVKVKVTWNWYVF